MIYGRFRGYRLLRSARGPAVDVAGLAEILERSLTSSRIFASTRRDGHQSLDGFPEAKDFRAVDNPREVGREVIGSVGEINCDVVGCSRLRAEGRREITTAMVAEQPPHPFDQIGTPSPPRGEGVQIESALPLGESIRGEGFRSENGTLLRDNASVLTPETPSGGFSGRDRDGKDDGDKSNSQTLAARITFAKRRHTGLV